ncbi:MAG TPA: AIR synthase-related protein, partial [bacterium]|nr:AIR synthase-related protein [bacterium]
EASTYLRAVHGMDRGRTRDVDFAFHRRVLAVAREAVRAGWARSAHDCAEGGLAVAVAESAVAGGVGAEIVVPGFGRRDAALFGEAPSRIVLSVPAAAAPALFALAAQWNAPVTVLGRVGGTRLRIAVAGATRPRRWDLDLSCDELRAAYDALAEVFA